MVGYESSDPETGRGDQDEFIAPTLGMLCAAEVFLRVRGGAGPYSARLHYATSKTLRLPPRATGSPIPRNR